MKTNIDHSLEDYVKAVEAERLASDNYIKHAIWIIFLVGLIIGFITCYLLTHKL